MLSHICHITTAHDVFDTRIFKHECISLAKSGFKVSLIAQHKQRELVQGVDILPLSKPPSSMYRRLILTRQAAQIASSLKADLYHFHDPELIPVMRQLARKTGKPVIWDAHENYVQSIRHFNSARYKPLSNLVARQFDQLEISACKKDFAGVITINEVMAKRYTSHNIRTSVVGNFAHIDEITYPSRVKRADKPRLVSSGAQFIDRAVYEIVDAFRMLRPVIPCQVAFWGVFQPPSLANDLKSRAATAEAPSNDILIGGPYPWKILVEELIPTAWAGCVLFNIKNENNRNGLPNRLFEYWTNAVPVIATAGTEVASLVQTTGAGLIVENNSPVELSKAFRQLAEDRALVEKMGLAGREAVEQKYNWASDFRKLLHLYEIILN